MPCVQPNVSEYKLTTLTDLFVYAFVTDHDVPYCNLLDRYKAVVGTFFSLDPMQTFSLILLFLFRSRFTQ